MVVLWFTDKFNLQIKIMKRLVFEGLIIILLFFGTWFALNQIDWIKIFKVQKVTDTTEQKLGELFWDFFKKSEDEISDKNVIEPVSEIVAYISKANKINRDKIKVHVLNNDNINAFALPGGHLIIYTGLISKCDNEGELSGVICHEIAHIELNHVMKKLITEIGLSVLISITTGSGGADVIKEAVKLLSSTAFDRSLEKEADIKAVDYLIEAKLNPELFAAFLFKHSDNENEAANYWSWISTHPDSKERSEYILDYSKDKLTEFKLILTPKQWGSLKAASAVTE